MVLRTGIVLSASGGALAKQLPLFRLGVGGRIGSGRQYRSWITLDDEVRAILHCLDHATLSGPVNAVGPHPATDAELATALGHALHRPSFMAVPAAAIKLALGSEMATDMVLSGQRVVPEQLQRSGFTLRAPRPRRGGALGGRRVLTGSVSGRPSGRPAGLSDQLVALPRVVLGSGHQR